MFISPRDRRPAPPHHQALNRGTPDNPHGTVYLAQGGTIGFADGVLWRTKGTPPLDDAALDDIGAELARLFPGWTARGQLTLCG